MLVATILVGVYLLIGLSIVWRHAPDFYRRVKQRDGFVDPFRFYKAGFLMALTWPTIYYPRA